MSRSYKKAIYKDKGIKSIYWRIIRSATKNFIRSKKHTLEDEIIPDKKEIVNNYNYCDYIIDFYSGSLRYVDINKEIGAEKGEVLRRKLKRK